MSIVVLSRGFRTRATVVAFFSIGLLSGCDGGSRSSSRKADDKIAPPAKMVKTARSISKPLERTVTVLGSLVAHEQATLSAKVSGRLKQIEVDLGTSVKAGAMIAQIEIRDYQLKEQQSKALLAQARAGLGLPPDGAEDRVVPEHTSTVKLARALLDEAKANRERILKLTEQSIISKAEMETAAAAHDVAVSRYQDALEEVRQLQAVLLQRRAELEIARQQLTDTTILAPFDGAIQERRANVGEYLTVGAPIATLVRIDPLRLRLEIPERDARKIRAGQLVRLKIESDSKAHTGEIKRISPAITEQNRILIVEADVPNDGTLHAGSFVRAEIVMRDLETAVTVPPAAIITFAGLEKVFVVQSGKAVEKPVTTGDRGQDWVEIVVGLQAGEEVVVEAGNLQTGQPVTTGSKMSAQK